MPRRAREKSSSGIYHIMLRGINKQKIFYDDEDKVRFLETLNRFKHQSGIKVHGWCLMNNHIHLLLEEGKEDISLTLKRVGVSFVWYYNEKYERSGHLFQDRYRSENVETDRYCLTVVRYIHQNPVKAGIAKNPEDWQWSSCRAYYGEKESPLEITYKDFILGMFDSDKETAIAGFREFNKCDNEDTCLDTSQCRRLTDKEARQEIKRKVREVDLAEIKRLPRKERNNIIKQIIEIEGVSKRQAARILGVPPGLMFRL